MRGNPRFGLKYVEGELVGDEEEQKVVREIVRLKDETNSSFSYIAGLLNSTHQLNRGRFWNSTTVRSAYRRSEETLAFPTKAAS